jgi:hypothetical protein
MQKEKPSPKPSGSAKPARKTGKAILIGVLTIGTAGLGYLAWRRFRRKPMEDSLPAESQAPTYNPPAYNGGGSSGASSSTSTAPKYRPDTIFPLTIYAKGENVKLIQAALNAKFKAGLTVDGYWGAKTEQALIAHGLPTSITKAQLDSLKAQVRQGALAGLAQPGQQVVTARPALVWSERHQSTAQVRAGELLGTLAREEGGKLQVLTPGNDILLVHRSDVLVA